jgi:hypothetical protein
VCPHAAHAVPQRWKTPVRDGRATPVGRGGRLLAFSFAEGKPGMRPSSSTIGRMCLVAAALLPVVAAGANQVIAPVEHIDFDRPEAWAMKYFASASLMNGLGTPRALRTGQFRLGLEGEWLPFVSDQQKFVGFTGTKSDDLNKLPVYGRLELTVGLPYWFQVKVGYVPPIPINGVQANLFSVALARPIFLPHHITIGLSLYGQVGTVEGDFTCTASEVLAGNDLQKNPFGCTAKSQDRLDMDYVGFELSVSYRIDRLHGLEPYTSVAGNFMDLTFRVNAEYSGILDLTELDTQGGTFSTASGLLYPITRRLDVVGEVFYSPLTVQRPQNGLKTTVEGLLNVRALIAYRFF